MSIAGLDSPRTSPEPLGGRHRLAIALLILSGVVIIPGALNRFVLLKLALASLAVAVAFTSSRHGQLPRRAIALLAAGAGALMLGALVGDANIAQVLGRAPRFEGALALAVYLGALATGARLLPPGRRAAGAEAVVEWLAVAALLVAVVGLAQEVTADILPGTGDRPGSLLGNASEQGAWSALALGPLLAYALVRPGPLIAAAALAAAVGVTLSGSRGALAAGLCVVAVLAVTGRGGRPRTVLGVLACVFVAALLLPGPRTSVTSPEALATGTVHGRLLLWRDTLRMIEDRPAGVGLGGFVDAFAQQRSTQFAERYGETDHDSPHQWILQAASAGGVLLAALAVALAALVLLAGWRTCRREPDPVERAAVAGFLAALCGYAVALSFHFTSPGTTPTAALFAGALLAIPATTAHRAANAIAVFVSPAMAGLVIVLGLAALGERPLRAAVSAAAVGDITRAESEFRSAERVRPWDSSVDALAAHAFAELAARGERPAAEIGRRWARDAVRATPESASTLFDASRLAEATGATSEALSLLRRAAHADPFDREIDQRLRQLQTALRIPDR